VPVQKNSIRVRHIGREETRLTNLSGPPLTWIAQFYGAGAALLVDGKPVPTSSSLDLAGLPLIFARLTVDPGKTMTVLLSPEPR
jgi:hypothetical protein